MALVKWFVSNALSTSSKLYAFLVSLSVEATGFFGVIFQKNWLFHRPFCCTWYSVKRNTAIFVVRKNACIHNRDQPLLERCISYFVPHFVARIISLWYLTWQPSVASFLIVHKLLGLQQDWRRRKCVLRPIKNS